VAHLTTHMKRWCSENVSYLQKFTGSHGKIYTVTCNEMNAGPHVLNWHCTCKGWQYKGKCKHQAIAVGRRCRYGSDIYSSGSSESDTCPRCGGPTEVVRVAV